MLLDLEEKLVREGKITFMVKVTPKSGKHEISKVLANHTIKIKLKSAPEQNKANEELIELLSDWFKVPEQNIKILKGRLSGVKTILIGEM